MSLRLLLYVVASLLAEADSERQLPGGAEGRSAEGAEIRDAAGVERVGNGKGVSPSQAEGIWGSVVRELPQRGPGPNTIWAHFNHHRSLLVELNHCSKKKNLGDVFRQLFFQQFRGNCYNLGLSIKLQTWKKYNMTLAVEFSPAGK